MIDAADTPHSVRDAATGRRWPAPDGIPFLRAGREALAAEALAAARRGRPRRSPRRCCSPTRTIGGAARPPSRRALRELVRAPRPPVPARGDGPARLGAGRRLLRAPLVRPDLPRRPGAGRGALDRAAPRLRAGLRHRPPPAGARAPRRRGVRRATWCSPSSGWRGTGSAPEARARSASTPAQPWPTSRSASTSSPATTPSTSWSPRRRSWRACGRCSTAGARLLAVSHVHNREPGQPLGGRGRDGGGDGGALPRRDPLRRRRADAGAGRGAARRARRHAPSRCTARKPSPPSRALAAAAASRSRGASPCRRAGHGASPQPALRRGRRASRWPSERYGREYGPRATYPPAQHRAGARRCWTRRRPRPGAAARAARPAGALVSAGRARRSRKRRCGRARSAGAWSASAGSRATTRRPAMRAAGGAARRGGRPGCRRARRRAATLGARACARGLRGAAGRPGGGGRLRRDAEPPAPRGGGGGRRRRQARALREADGRDARRRRGHGRVRAGAPASPTAPPSTSATIPRMRPSATRSRPARSARSPPSASPMPAGWIAGWIAPTTGAPTRCAPAAAR